MNQSKFKIGDKVKCIDFDSFYDLPHIKENQIYTVEALDVHFAHSSLNKIAIKDKNGRRSYYWERRFILAEDEKQTVTILD